MTGFLTIGASVLELTPPRNGRLETAPRFDVTVTGPESNAAVAASRLGGDPVWASKLPDTPLGRHVTGTLGRHGVETAVCWSETDRMGLAFSERAGAPRGETVVHDRAGAAAASLTPDELPASALEEASMVLTSGASAALSETLAETVTTAFEKSTGTTALSLSRPRVIDSPVALAAVEPLLSAADVLLTTEEGAAALDDRASATELVHALAAGHDFETMVLARDARGALVWHRKSVHEHTPPATESVDDRGAFDALCGGFLARRLAGDAPDSALATGVACSALARTISGPIPAIDRTDVERCVDSMESSGMG